MTAVEVIDELFLNGIQLFGSNNVVVGCYIGTDQRGVGIAQLAPVDNASGGVAVLGPGNRVGGTAAADRNIIVSGNDGVRALREWLIREKHLQPQVEYEIEDHPGRRRAVFRIQPGPRYDKVVLAFEGASGIGPDTLDKIIEDQGLERQLFMDPGAVTDLLQRYYREQGYLSVAIDAPRCEFRGTTARAVLAVREGGRFAVGQVTTAAARPSNVSATARSIASMMPAAFCASGSPGVLVMRTCSGTIGRLLRKLRRASCGVALAIGTFQPSWRARAAISAGSASR